MARRVITCAVAVVALGSAPAGARAAGSPSVAALQVALTGRSLYSGTIDGVMGPATRAGVVRVERRAGLPQDGVAGPRVRRKLGRLGRHPLGSRDMRPGDVGWDVAALQFRLAWHGFPSGTFDGGYGALVEAAVVRFQTLTHLCAYGAAGFATLGEIRRHRLP